jgi:SAM-dependent methyltransferase
VRFSYKPLRVAPSRDAEILRLCRGKRVLHIGATDSPFTVQKLEDGTLLHTKLTGVAAELLGIDIDQSAIDLLAQRGVHNIVNLDMNEVHEIRLAPEVILLGETIEHLENIGTCLANLRRIMGPDTLLVISIPNCYAILWTAMVLLDFESIHDDHKVGFSYGLLRQLLTANGFEIVDFCFTYLDRARLAWWQQAWRLAGRLRRGFAETLLFVCRVAPASARAPVATAAAPAAAGALGIR